MKFTPIITLILLFPLVVHAQTNTTEGTFFKPFPRNYNVKHAIEVESLVPMFFYGGYHVAIGYFPKA